MTPFGQSVEIPCKEFKRTPCTFFHWPAIRCLAFRDICPRLIASPVLGSERSLIAPWAREKQPRTAKIIHISSKDENFQSRLAQVTTSGHYLIPHGASHAKLLDLGFPPTRKHQLALLQGVQYGTGTFPPLVRPPKQPMGQIDT